jgi:hypothetical protein
MPDATDGLMRPHRHATMHDQRHDNGLAYVGNHGTRRAVLLAGLGRPGRTGCRCSLRGDRAAELHSPYLRCLQRHLGALADPAGLIFGHGRQNVQRQPRREGLIARHEVNTGIHECRDEEPAGRASLPVRSPCACGPRQRPSPASAGPTACRSRPRRTGLGWRRRAGAGRSRPRHAGR